MAGQYRHEMKFLISWKDMAQLKEKLLSILLPDPNATKGQYFIRSLYFDDIYQSAYAEKLIGISCRKKYRIRIYDCSDRIIRLERKKKYKQYILKESVKLTRDEFFQIIAGECDFLLQRPENLAKEFYFEYTSNILRPKIIVDYDREPLVYKSGDVRITFDKHVRASTLNYNIFDTCLPTYGVIDEGKLVLEVKFTEFLPNLIRKIISPDNFEQVAVSKYVLCYEKIQALLRR